MSTKISGVIPVLPSIFDDSGQLDEPGMQAVLEYIIDAGADGVVFPGLASEYEQLTPDERDHTVKQIGKWIDNRISFVVGASSDDPRLAAQYAVAGAEAGASAAMIMTPRQLSGDLAAISEFYDHVGKSTGMAIMVQNAPKPMGLGLSIDDLLDVVRGVSHIASIKEETPPCGQRISSILARETDMPQSVFGGAGGRHLIDELNRGALGTVPACEITEIHVAIVRAHQEKNEQLARELFERSLPLLNMQAVFRWRFTKSVLKRRGLIKSAYTRAPGPVLDRADEIELGALLDRVSDLTGISTQRSKGQLADV